MRGPKILHANDEWTFLFRNSRRCLRTFKVSASRVPKIHNEVTKSMSTLILGKIDKKLTQFEFNYYYYWLFLREVLLADVGDWLMQKAGTKGRQKIGRASKHKDETILRGFFYFYELCDGFFVELWCRIVRFVLFFKTVDNRAGYGGSRLMSTIAFVDLWVLGLKRGQKSGVRARSRSITLCGFLRVL